MSEKYITITGARENNLKNINLRIPKGKITIFTGGVRFGEIVGGV